MKIVRKKENLDAEYRDLVRRIRLSQTGRLRTLWRHDLGLLFDYCYSWLSELIMEDPYGTYGYILNPAYHIGDIHGFVRDAAYFAWAIRWEGSMDYAVTELRWLSSMIKRAAIREGYCLDSVSDILRELDLACSKSVNLNRTLQKLRKKL